jgi:phosphoenolpyruvate synthase/pyruvate phosphate dikinase
MVIRMKAEITVCDGILPIEKYGGKSYWISWLIANGYNVPKSICISSLNRDDAESDTKDQLFIDTLSGLIDLDCKYSVRSSGENEDSFADSKAGNYKTFLNVAGIDNILEKYFEVVGSTKNSNEKMGVIIQPMVDAKISGVVFSSNPRTGSKIDFPLSYKKGLGEKLLDGTSEGIDIRFTVDDTGAISCTSNLSDKQFLTDIAKIAKKIEKELNLPVDIEWCMDHKNKPVLLQCRPITTIFINLNKIYKVNSSIMDIIPDRYIRSDKITLRFIAEKYGIHISDAYLLVCDLKEDQLPLDEIDIQKSKYYKSYNVVVLFPPKIDGKIVRAFIGNSENGTTSISCWRFGLRSTPEYKNLGACLKEYYSQIKKYYWSCSIIIQEIYTPIYTGIIKKTDSNFIIEVAKGHFVAKGSIPTSSYILDKDGNTIRSNEIIQTEWTEIVEGHIIRRTSTDFEKTELNEDNKKIILERFTPLFEGKKASIEFGLLASESETIPYLIDYVSDEKDGGIEADSIEKGIISSGRISGRLVKLELSSGEDALHTHFHNSQDGNAYEDIEPTIFYAELPSIEFINILNVYDNKKIGFVFNSGSMLCHLSVLLREKSIPAVFLRNKIKVDEGTLYTIDTGANELFSQKCP